MKVVCIDDTKWHKDFSCPSFSEVCTVSESSVSRVSGELVYSFFEYPTPIGHGFRHFSQKYFAPVSDIDETELVNEKEEVYV
jgi:hypothetical protein